jgi:glycosyltransferase involved in cell wall biosynthesis
MSSPEVSVIIPTCNRPDLLSRAIESVLYQTYSNFECIVVDDASPADSSSVVAGFDDERLEYFEHETNQGASVARNTGIEKAHGEYIAFLDDDDEWLPTKLEKQVELFSELDDEYAIVYCWMDYCRNSDGKVVKEYQPKHQGYIFPQMLDSQVIGSSSTLLVRREIAEQTQFDESLPRGNDGDFIRSISKNYKVDYVPAVLVNYYIKHGERRITNEDEKGIHDAIKGQKLKFKRFNSELEKHPDRAGRIYAKIAFRYAQLGEWQNCKENYQKAIFKAPTSFEVYKSIARSAKRYLKI